MKLGLGTAQFGMAYGVANTNGQPAIETVAQVLHVARANGIQMLDTAISYGDSEAVLGELGVSDFLLVTKIPEIPIYKTDIAAWL